MDEPDSDPGSDDVEDGIPVQSPTTVANYTESGGGQGGSRSVRDSQGGSGQVRNESRKLRHESGFESGQVRDESGQGQSGRVRGSQGCT